VLELAEATDVWRVLPAEVAGPLRLEADASVAEMAEAIQAEVAEYSQPLDAAYAGALTRAVRHAVDTFIDRVADPDTPMTAIVFRWPGPPRRCAGRGWRSASPPGASSTAASTWCAATSTCPPCSSSPTRSWPAPCGRPGSARCSAFAPPSRIGWPRRCWPGSSTAATPTRWPTGSGPDNWTAFPGGVAT